MEERQENKTMRRRAVRIRIDAQLRSQYQAVLCEDVPKQFFDLLSLSSTMVPDAADVKHNS
jgi:hypothetical protein